MKKFVLSAAVLAISTGGMTAAVSFAAPPEASACAFQSPTSTALAASLPQVNHGDHGQHVLALQLALRAEGYTYLRGTGTYAGETLRAVKDYQRKNGIKASGVVGSKTWQALVGRKKQSVTGGAPGSVQVFTLRPGQKSEQVPWLVNMLIRVYPYSGTAHSWETGDVYGPELQKRCAISRSGPGSRPAASSARRPSAPWTRSSRRPAAGAADPARFLAGRCRDPSCGSDSLSNRARAGRPTRGATP
jgi:peptidoglycan hydrolase-like protein with peptidoglycan-binding domain